MAARFSADGIHQAGKIRVTDDVSIRTIFSGGMTPSSVTPNPSRDHFSVLVIRSLVPVVR
jgi:hypothetical protein